MIKWLMLLLFFLYIPVQADSLELMGGSLTEHYQSNPEYVGKIGTGNGLIYNALVGVRYNFDNYRTKWYTSTEIFGGLNSVHEGMVGAAGVLGYSVINEFLYTGAVIGMYTQNHSAFLNRGLVPFNLTQIGDYDLVPVVGIEINFKLNLTDALYLKLNNLITPILTNTSLSLGVKL